jgi:hypothetical protein
LRACTLCSSRSKLGRTALSRMNAAPASSAASTASSAAAILLVNLIGQGAVVENSPYE